MGSCWCLLGDSPIGDPASCSVTGPLRTEWAESMVKQELSFVHSFPSDRDCKVCSLPCSQGPTDTEVGLVGRGYPLELG